MSNPQIEAFVAQQNVFLNKIEGHVTGLTGDVKSLNDTILLLQKTPGVLTPQDQALLDSIQAKTEALVGGIEALDALTPPVLPPV